MRLLRHAVVFAALFAFTATWAAAEPRQAARTRVEPRSQSVSALLSHLWGSLTSLWAAVGSCPDPLGSTTPNTGWSMDPLGSPMTDAGWSADPLG